MRVAEPDARRAAWLRNAHGVEVVGTGADAADGAAALVLAVKPQVMAEALQGVRPAPGTAVVSIAAGVRVASLRSWLGDGAVYALY